MWLRIAPANKTVIKHTKTTFKPHMAAAFKVGVCYLCMLFMLGTAQAAVVAEQRLQPVHHANFGQENAALVTRQVANWVVASGDNRGQPFLIVDKVYTKVFVFQASGQLIGATAALIGLAVGDDSVPGIGERKLSTILPRERTTPAGRFVASLDHNITGGEILWVDYDGAISLHPVFTGNIQEHRAQRLATATTHDNRISYGCINVSLAFFNNVVRPAFQSSSGIVYVLPETRTAKVTFGIP